MKPVDVTVNLCSLLSGALCPLPTYNFTGTDWLSLPKSLGVSHKIPSIAFKIPDLEAFAQFTLVEVNTGNVKACVQSTLSNGWSTRQTGVEWSTAILALIALFSAIWQSRTPDAVAPFRLVDLLLLYQSIAITSFLDLDYPSVYLSFALNFAWSLGLVFTSPSSSVQNTINRMRHLTGGNMADVSGVSPIGLVNRKLSPYNFPSFTSLSHTPSSLLGRPSANVSILSTAIAPAFSPPSDLTSGMMQLTSGEVVTVTSGSANVLQAGVPIYVNSVFVATANAFMTVFICVLTLVAIALTTFSLGYLGLLALNSHRDKPAAHRADISRAYLPYLKAWSLRLVSSTLTSP
jgi:hypothetical protein